jgi:GT2 family glycosyltransferase
MLNTYLGSHGSVQGRRYERDRFVPHIPTVNILYHKPTVYKMGGFDVTFGNIGEDQDLSYRLEKADYRLVYLADVAVVHKMRPTWKSWFTNMYVYGKGRMWLMRKHPDKVELALLAPMFLILSMFFVLFSFLTPICAAPILYFPVIFFTSVIESIKCNKLHFVLHLFALYVGTHFAYGLGELGGFLKNRELYRLITSHALVLKAEKSRG